MPTDIVIPQNNEKDFIEIAIKLGYERLIFAYDKDNDKRFDNKDIKIEKAIITDNINKIKNKNQLILVDPKEKIRSIVENNKGLILFDIEKGGNDYIHQRNSGLDHVIAKLCRERKHSVLFCFNGLDDKLMGRMKQNIKLARKFKFKAVIASLARNPLQMSAPLDVISLFKVLGMTGKEGKESLNY